MSEQLLRIMKQRIDREGPVAKLRMAASVHKGTRMIDRYMNGQTLPRPEVARVLALECGASDKLAIEIEKESHLLRTKSVNAS